MEPGQSQADRRVDPRRRDSRRSAPGDGPPLEAGDDGRAVPAAARDRLARFGAAVGRRELEQAVTTLEARGDLSAAQRRIVADLVAGIVDGVLAPPTATLAAAGGDDGGDPGGDAEPGVGADRLARTAVRLFDLSEQRHTE